MRECWCSKNERAFVDFSRDAAHISCVLFLLFTIKMFERVTCETYLSGKASAIFRCGIGVAN